MTTPTNPAISGVLSDNHGAAASLSANSLEYAGAARLYTCSRCESPTKWNGICTDCMHAEFEGDEVQDEACPYCGGCGEHDASGSRCMVCDGRGAVKSDALIGNLPPSMEVPHEKNK